MSTIPDGPHLLQALTAVITDPDSVFGTPDSQSLDRMVRKTWEQGELLYILSEDMDGNLLLRWKDRWDRTMCPQSVFLYMNGGKPVQTILSTASGSISRHVALDLVTDGPLDLFEGWLRFGYYNGPFTWDQIPEPYRPLSDRAPNACEIEKAVRRLPKVLHDFVGSFTAVRSDNDIREEAVSTAPVRHLSAVA